jgi:hypothetical protein
VSEASEVADLGDQPERGQRRDPAKRPQVGDLPRLPVVARDVFEMGVKGGELTVEAVEVDEHLGQRFVRKRIVELLAADPRAVLQGPGLLAVAVDPAVAQQLLSNPVTGRGPRAADVIATAQQVSEPLSLGGRWLNESQSPTAEQADELLGVAAVGLDADLPRGPEPATERSHHTRHPLTRAVATARIRPDRLHS